MRFEGAYGEYKGFDVEKVGWDVSALPRSGNLGKCLVLRYIKKGSKWVLTAVESENFNFKKFVLNMSDSEVSAWSYPSTAIRRSYRFTRYGHLPMEISETSKRVGKKTVKKFYFSDENMSYTMEYNKYKDKLRFERA